MTPVLINGTMYMTNIVNQLSWGFAVKKYTTCTWGVLQAL